MIPHLFKPGQRVAISVRMPSSSPTRGTYRVVLQMPPEAGDNMYRIKSDLEEHERVVGESRLVRLP